MQTKIQDEFTANIFDKYLKDGSYGVISVDKAKENMKKDVEVAEKDNIDFSKLVGKTYSYIECSNLFGCKYHATVSFSTTQMSYNTLAESGKVPLEVKSDGIFLITWEDEDTEYWKTLDISTSVLIR